jgi:hypothetical protein
LYPKAEISDGYNRIPQLVLIDKLILLEPTTNMMDLIKTQQKPLTNG